VCCQVEVSATSWSLVQRSPTDFGASLCVIKKPQKWGGHGPRWAAAPQKTKQTSPSVRLGIQRSCQTLKGPFIETVCSVNPLTPNDHYSGRTASLTSKLFILYIYSTNIGTEYFKHGIHSLCFSLQNAVCFIILTYLFTFYIQCAKIKKNSGTKRLRKGSGVLPESASLIVSPSDNNK